MSLPWEYELVLKNCDINDAGVKLRFNEIACSIFAKDAFTKYPNVLGYLDTLDFVTNERMNPDVFCLALEQKNYAIFNKMFRDIILIFSPSIGNCERVKLVTTANVHNILSKLVDYTHNRPEFYKNVPLLKYFVMCITIMIRRETILSCPSIFVNNSVNGEDNSYIEYIKRYGFINSSDLCVTELFNSDITSSLFVILCNQFNGRVDSRALLTNNGFKKLEQILTIYKNPKDFKFIVLKDYCSTVQIDYQKAMLLNNYVNIIPTIKKLVASLDRIYNINRKRDIIDLSSDSIMTAEPPAKKEKTV